MTDDRPEPDLELTVTFPQKDLVYQRDIIAQLEAVRDVFNLEAVFYLLENGEDFHQATKQASMCTDIPLSRFKFNSPIDWVYAVSSTLVAGTFIFNRVLASFRKFQAARVSKYGADNVAGILQLENKKRELEATRLDLEMAKAQEKLAAHARTIADKDQAQWHQAIDEYDQLVMADLVDRYNAGMREIQSIELTPVPPIELTTQQAPTN